MPGNIPEGITLDDFNRISDQLTRVLNDIGASQVSMRLNESQRDGDPAANDTYYCFSFFVGSVQNQATRDARIARQMPDPGLYRFGDSVNSKEIREAVGKAVAGNVNDLFATRGWEPRTPLETQSQAQKGMGSRGMGRESGLQLQKYIGILINGRCVGALGVSFRAVPADLAAVEDRIRNWVREPGTPNTLIDYLRNTFNLWGPRCP